MPEQDAPTGQPQPSYIHPNVELGEDLIVDALRKRALREVSEGDASLADADEVLGRLLALSVRRLYTKAGVLGVQL